MFASRRRQFFDEVGVVYCSAGFSLRGFDLARTKIHRLKPARLES